MCQEWHAVTKGGAGMAKGMRFKIGDVAKMTGFSPSGIRYYEEQGLLHLEPHGKGGTRSFSLADASRLVDCRNLRECGCAMEEIGRMVSRSGDIGEEALLLERTCEKLHRDVVRKERIETMLRKRVQMMKRLDSGDVPLESSARPSMYWMPLVYRSWLPGEDEGFPCPFSDVSLLIEPGELGASEHSPSQEDGLAIGYCVERDYSDSAPMDPTVRFFSYATCLYTYIRVEGDCSVEAGSLASLREHLRKRGLVAAGPALTRRFHSVHTDDADYGYHELWVPVR